MGWLDYLCCWKRGSLQDERASICASSPTHTSSEITKEEHENVDRGVSPDLRDLPEVRLLNQSYEPLATPRRPLRRSIESLTPPDTPPLQPIKLLKGDLQYMNFPVLMEDYTIDYVKRNKLMVILKGLPGSGKTTISENLREVYTDIVVCSADHYFMVDGVYKFDGEKLKEAHETCQEKAREAAQNNIPVIVIDNTNVRHWEYQIYLQISREYQYVALIIECKTPWCFDATQLASRNSHGIDADYLFKKVKTYQHPAPIYYGWFLNEADSITITKMARQWLERALLEVEDFFKDFSNFAQQNSVEGILAYHTRDRNILHLTAKFTNRGKPEGAMEYIKSNIVKSAMGRCYPLNVIGYVVTPRTFGARILLTEEELKLWGQNDKETPPDSHKRARDGGHNKNQFNPCIDSTQIDISMTVDANDPEIDESFNQPRVSVVPQDLVNRFCPVAGIGSRAHLTLGCSSGIKPVATGFDLIDIVNCEQNSSKLLATYDITGAVLKFYGEGRWVIYPETKAVAESLFSAFY
ncbi:hypothetical protein SK128_006482 [Halocaridina rubra]|uniref:2',3'-cyclic-nucleotide 3'-phosphodiesterase n=1 Tax=Halocaridina rubra TaxID=373956 RepID=A0AAN8XBY2_HALRR